MACPHVKFHRPDTNLCAGCSSKPFRLPPPPGPPPPVNPCAQLCCLRPQCQKLRVIVICSAPWTPIPGAAINPSSTEPNQPPASHQYPVTPGLPINVRLAAKPAAVATPLLGSVVAKGRKNWNTKYNVPQALFAKYGNTLSNAKNFVFDFGVQCGKYRNAEGQLLAYGGCGKLQASLKFVYRWCGPQRCGDEVLPPFEIIGCTSKNVKFVVLGDVNDYLPKCECTNECYEPIVVLGIQQYCCAAYDDQVPGIGECLEPTGCSKLSLDCVDQSLLSRCVKA